MVEHGIPQAIGVVDIFATGLIIATHRETPFRPVFVSPGRAPMHLSDLTLKRLRVPARGRVTYSDDSVPGFAVLVSASGVKSFVLLLGRSRKRVSVLDVAAAIIRICTTSGDTRQYSQGEVRNRQDTSRSSIAICAVAVCRVIFTNHQYSA